MFNQMFEDEKKLRRRRRFGARPSVVHDDKPPPDIGLEVPESVQQHIDEAKDGSDKLLMRLRTCHKHGYGEYFKKKSTEE